MVHARRHPDEDASGAHDAFVAITSTIAERSSAADVATVAAAEVRRLIPCDRCVVWQWLPERDAVQTLAVDDSTGRPIWQPGEVVTLTNPAIRGVLQHGRVFREADLRRRDAPAERALAAEGYRARLIVPVVLRGRAIAHIAVTSRRRGAFTAAHERLLTQLALHLAVGLEQARLAEADRRHRDRLLGLQRVAQILAARATDDDLFDLVLEEAVRAMGGDSGALLLWDAERRCLVPVRGAVETAHEDGVLQPGQGIAGRAAEQHRVVIAHDDRPGAGDARTDGPRAAIGAPLMVDGELLGVVTVARLDPHRRFDAVDGQVFELFAGQAATAIKTARLFAAERRQHRQMEAVRAVTAELTRELDLTALLDAIIDRAAGLVRSQAGSVLLWDEAGEVLVPRAWRGFGDWAADVRIRPGESAAGLAIQRRQGVIVADVLGGVVRACRARTGGERIVATLPAHLEADVDPDRLRQIVENLLANALAYATEGPILLRAAGTGHALIISVEDRGPGLSPEDQARVWEIFYRGTQATSVPHRGSGLGLAAVKRLVELHGGRVGVRSAAGQGACFWVSLPLARGVVGATVAAEAVAPR